MKVSEVENTERGGDVCSEGVCRESYGEGNVIIVDEYGKQNTGND